MKNKKLTYLLIAVVVAVWGVIIHRLVNYTDTGSVPTGNPVAGKETTKESPGYELILDYRDPFLEEKANRPVSRIRSSSAGIIPEEYVEAPQLYFKGVISQAGKLYAILDTGSGSEILRQGEDTGEFRIAAVTADSVVLKKGKQVFILKLQ